MRDYHQRALEILLDRPVISRCLDTLHDFLVAFPPAEMERQSWELLHIAFTSEQADTWSSQQRSNLLIFYRQLSGLAPVLGILDKDLRVLFRKEE